VPTGPYEAADIADAKKIVIALAKECDAETSRPIREILEQLATDTAIGKLIKNSLQAKPEPFPRAFDVHGLFSTEPDAFGGFTDISPWIRGNDANADVTVFWRDWDVAKKNPNAPEYSGPAYQRDEGCPVTVYRLRSFIASAKAAFMWNDKTGKWKNVRADSICPGMVILLPASAGGYSETSGWSGNKKSRFASPLPAPGPFDADSDDDDKLTEVKRQWVALDQHLAAVAFDAERIGKALALPEPLLIALTRAASLHDIGKSFPQWQDALPKPRPDAITFWAKAPCFAKRAGMRHEAASALAAWHSYYRTGVAHFPALTIYLIAAHHGLMRTVLASRVNASQPNVCGIPVTIPPPELPWRPNPTDKWILDFTCAQDGTDGEFSKGANDTDVFIPVAPGWTALVADLLGGWEANAPQVAAGAVPNNEPHTLNPFNLAFLEALLRAADWRVSANETGIPADSINLQPTPGKKS
jgi:CRISPR-associated endonuclease/helicase Cas3